MSSVEELSAQLAEVTVAVQEQGDKIRALKLEVKAGNATQVRWSMGRWIPQDGRKRARKEEKRPNGQFFRFYSFFYIRIIHIVGFK